MKFIVYVDVSDNLIVISFDPISMLNLSEETLKSKFKIKTQVSKTAVRKVLI